jgi:hypothetical protein
MAQRQAEHGIESTAPRAIVPLGGGIGKIFKIGKLPFNGSIQAYSNVVTPSNGPDWTIRAQIALLLPKSMF